MRNTFSGDFVIAHDQCARPELQRPSEDSVDSEQDVGGDDDDVDEFEQMYLLSADSLVNRRVLSTCNQSASGLF